MKRLMYAVGDCLVLSGRGARHMTRRLDTLVTAVILPMVLLLLFVCLFGGAIQVALGARADYTDYVLPGILLSSIGYVATTTASSVNDDVKKGFVARLCSMPVARPAFIVGHTFASLIRSTAAIVAVTGLAVVIGYRSSASLTDWLVAACLLMAFALAMTAVAIVLGLVASGPDAASAFGMPLMFLSYFSGALVPIDTMPQALQAFCTYQPVNVVWEAVSGLTLGGGGYSIGAALAWCVGIAAAGILVSSMLFARKATG